MYVASEECREIRMLWKLCVFLLPIEKYTFRGSVNLSEPVLVYILSLTTTYPLTGYFRYIILHYVRLVYMGYF